MQLEAALALLLASCVCPAASARGAAGGRPAFLARARLLVEAAAERQEQGSEGLRPIITGCFEQCGSEDQACVTQCQVCVEERACPTVQSPNCRKCLVHAHAARRAYTPLDDVILDSGGVPLLHDHVRSLLLGAQLAAYDARRLLRRARGSVLKAQRQAEWAMEETGDCAAKLSQSQAVLKNKDAELETWKLQNARKLKALRAKRSEQRAELKRTEVLLERARKRFALVQYKARYARNRQRWLRLLPQVRDSFVKLKAKAFRLREQVAESQKEVQEAESKGRWVERGLTRERDKAQQLVKKDVRRLHTAQQMERLLNDELDKAKATYRRASAASQVREAKAAELKVKLSQHPLPTHEEFIAQYNITVSTPPPSQGQLMDAQMPKLPSPEESA